MATVGALHHVELRTGDLALATRTWGWLLGELGYRTYQQWDQGISWILGDSYIVLEQAPLPLAHDRRGAGLSHLAFWAGNRADVDRLWQSAPRRGWSWLYTDRHPWAGGPDHYAAFLENSERFKIELVAASGQPCPGR